jgi:hypothetical protein
MAELDADFQEPGINPNPCDFSITLPSFAVFFGFSLPDIPFPPALPLPVLGFTLSCDPAKPVDVTAGLSYGGGRVARFDPDPDKDPTQ